LHSGHPDAGRGSPRTLRWLIVVVTVLLLLAVGWPLVSLAVSDDQPAAAGQPLAIGPGGDRSVTFTPGPNWVVHNAGTNPIERWSLSDGPVDVTVIYVTLLGRSQVGRLWPGLLSILRLGDASARLGRPATVTSLAGDRGLTGPLTANDWAGQATLFASPKAQFAIEFVSVAPVGDRAAALAASALVARSVLFATVTK